MVRIWLVGQLIVSVVWLGYRAGKTKPSFLSTRSFMSQKTVSEAEDKTIYDILAEVFEVVNGG